MTNPSTPSKKRFAIAVLIVVGMVGLAAAIATVVVFGLYLPRH